MSKIHNTERLNREGGGGTAPLATINDDPDGKMETTNIFDSIYFLK